MGLDIYFETRKRNYDKQDEYEQAKARLNHLYGLSGEEFDKRSDEVDECRQLVDDLDPHTEVAYFRKVNFLMDFFRYEGNCEYQEISRGLVEELVDNCHRVLDNHDLAEELLPTQGGFFFGSTQYDEYYFEDVADVCEKFETILKTVDFDQYILEMYCWW